LINQSKEVGLKRQSTSHLGRSCESPVNWPEGAVVGSVSDAWLGGGNVSLGLNSEAPVAIDATGQSPSHK